MVEEDRSRNLLVFGLAEQQEENVEQRVSEIFLELGEKPRVMAANRLGGMNSDKRSKDCRPVKVTLASATSAHQILTSTGRLKKTDRYKSVYVRPDRSQQERAARKLLLLDLKKAIETQPTLYHYIRDGTIHSKEKAAT